MAKDFVYMSNQQYEDFRRISQLELPSIHVVKSIQNGLNREQLIPERNEYGLYFNCADKMRLVVAKKLDKLTLTSPLLLRVNIRADATIVGKDLQQIDFKVTQGAG